jgi:hypothetical protein
MATIVLGVSVGYLCISYPRRLSFRRAAFSGVGLILLAVGLLL